MATVSNTAVEWEHFRDRIPLIFNSWRCCSFLYSFVAIMFTTYVFLKYMHLNPNLTATE